MLVECRKEQAHEKNNKKHRDRRNELVEESMEQGSMIRAWNNTVRCFLTETFPFKRFDLPKFKPTEIQPILLLKGKSGMGFSYLATSHQGLRYIS